MFSDELVAQLKVADNNRRMGEVARYHRLRGEIDAHQPGLIRRGLRAIAAHLPAGHQAESTAPRRELANLDRAPVAR